MDVENELMDVIGTFLKRKRSNSQKEPSLEKRSKSGLEKIKENPLFLDLFRERTYHPNLFASSYQFWRWLRYFLGVNGYTRRLT
jgi:hypothetical protein